MGETGKKVAAVGIISLLSYGLYRLARGPSGPSTYLRRGPLSFVMKLTQAGVDVGTTPAPGVETTALVHVANASMLGGTPVAVLLTIRLTPIWGTTTIAVADQSIGVAGGGTSDVSFKFTFPTASAGLAGSVTCQALSSAGVVVATLPLAVTIINPVTYAASGLLFIYDGATLVPAGQTLQVGKAYLAVWSVSNLSKYQITGINAPADLYVAMGVNYYKANGSLFSAVDLYTFTVLSFGPGEPKTLGVPLPSFTPPADVNGGSAKVSLVAGFTPVGVLLNVSQLNPVASIAYNIGLTW